MTRHATACDAWTVRLLPQGSASAAWYHMLCDGKTDAQASVPSVLCKRKERIFTDHRYAVENNKKSTAVNVATCQRTKTFANIHSCWLPRQPRKNAPVTTGRNSLKYQPVPLPNGRNMSQRMHVFGISTRGRDALEDNKKIHDCQCRNLSA